MASRCRPISKSASSLFRHATGRGSSRSLAANLLSSRSASPIFGVPREIRSLQSLLPFHSAVSAARLTSRLGIDSAGVSRSLFQGALCSSNPGV